LPTILDHPTQLASVHAASGCTTISPTEQFCTISTGGLTAFGVVFLVVLIAVAVLAIVAGVKIVSKAGYSGWWILITFVPIVGSIFLFVFAFSDWPVLREVRMLRAGQRGHGGGRWPGSPGGGVLPGTSVMPGQAASVEDAPMPSFGAFLRGESSPTDTGPSVTPGGPPAGWYPAPDGPQGRARYWDGSAWTEHYR
jgi:Protein of unknown function (DUF2510)